MNCPGPRVVVTVRAAPDALQAPHSVYSMLMGLLRIKIDAQTSLSSTASCRTCCQGALDYAVRAGVRSASVCCTCTRPSF